jgi:hypothetical protein
MKTIDDEGMSQRLADLPAPGLDERFAARALRVARAELAPEAEPPTPVRLRALVSRALVPALLLSAAGCRTVLTVEGVEKAFGAHTEKSVADK